MKRDAPLGQKPPAAARDARSLRAQLSRAVGEALRAVRTPRTAAPSKQRLHDVLWHDRTMLASADVAARPEPEKAPVAAPSGVAPAGVTAGVAETSDAVEVVSEGEVEAWFAAALEEPVTGAESHGDIDAAAFGDALEIAAERAERARADLNAGFDSLLSEITPVVLAVPAAAAVSPPEPPRVQIAEPSDLYSGADEITQPASPVPATTKPATPEPKAAAKATAADDEEVEEEPICTRSMARLLAGQGHRQRALRIYDVLLKANADDASLRAEADALRQSAS